MYKLYLTITILVFLCVVEYKKYRDLLAATVVYPMMWILSLAGVIIKGNEYYEVGWITVITIMLGYILFILGFSLKLYRGNPQINENTDVKDDIGHQIIGINLVVIISFIITVIAVVYGIKYIDYRDVIGSLSNIKQMIDAGEKPFPYIVIVSRYFLRCAIWYLSLVFFRIPHDISYRSKKGYNYKKAVFIRLIAVFAMALIIMFTDISKNDILMTLLPVIYIYIYQKTE